MLCDTHCKRDRNQVSIKGPKAKEGPEFALRTPGTL